jgi:hypothetical protein
MKGRTTKTSGRTAESSGSEQPSSRGFWSGWAFWRVPLALGACVAASAPTATCKKEDARRWLFLVLPLDPVLEKSRVQRQRGLEPLRGTRRILLVCVGAHGLVQACHCFMLSLSGCLVRMITNNLAQSFTLVLAAALAGFAAGAVVSMDMAGRGQRAEVHVA